MTAVANATSSNNNSGRRIGISIVEVAVIIRSITIFIISVFLLTTVITIKNWYYIVVSHVFC